VLGRPPLGWQKKLQMSLTEAASDNPEQRVPFPGNVPASPIKVLTRELKRGKCFSSHLFRGLGHRTKPIGFRFSRYRSKSVLRCVALSKRLDRK